MKNIKSTNTSNTTNKALTAWAVEVNGEIDPTDILTTRAAARNRCNTYVCAWSDAKVSVRKVMIVAVSGR